MPGNPWPHDMMLRIEDSPSALHELLWIREAWGLQPQGDDLPPLLAHPPEPVGLPAPEEWQRAWPDLWAACLAQAGRPHDPGLIGRLSDTSLGSEERARLLTELTGVSWRDRFGDEAFTSSFDAWSEAQRTAQHLRRPLAYDDTPERKSLDALIVAWQAGITEFVLIPCRGDFTRRLSPSTLLVTEATRNDPRRYAAALLAAA
ncbi:hypothetical protein [Herbiconiux liangxiaofengii]|uniref:hypothetical protein n=1 Tax=Herbiconiux liangxiaofengii TaxID=3342795 RepID=UPI0035B92705